MVQQGELGRVAFAGAFFASPIECRSMVVSYFLFHCVLVTFVGGVSSSAYRTHL